MIYKRSFFGLSVAPRKHRRLIVSAWWLLVLIVFAGFALLIKTHPRWFGSILFGYGFFFAFMAINSLGRWIWVPAQDQRKVAAGIRTLFDQAFQREREKNLAPDERERRQWDQAMRSAYSVLIIASLLLISIHYIDRVPTPLYVREPLIWFGLFSLLNLPQSIYLWTEPDLES